MPDSLTDPRDHLQRRVALSAGVACVFFGIVVVADFAAPAEGEPLFSSTRVASLSAFAANALVLAVTRRGERPTWVSRALELFSASVALMVFATLPLFPPIAGAGGVMVLFSPLLANVVVLLRAAIIPSPPWLSAGLAVAWGVVFCVCSYFGWEGVVITVPDQPPIDPRMFPLVYGMVATAFIAFVALAITRVVHGLQTRVREALELGQYTLESKLGEGGMGVVYRARHRMLRRPTAVKLLPPDKAGEVAVSRFEQEVRQTSRLTHPNTVAIFDYGRTMDGVFYYAMEYLDGISLQRLVDMTGPLPPARVIAVLVQIVESLAEAHGMGLVHRDIKPDNIMLCERGGIPDVVKVLDFGLVKDVQAPTDANLSHADTVKGTPLYMAPETLKSPEAVDARTDLYALGVVGYFLLSGGPPFEGSVVEILGHHLHTVPTPLSERGVNVEPALEAVIRRCLEKDPDDRHPDARRLRDALLGCPDAGGWSRADAEVWWSDRRATIDAEREKSLEPAALTLARA